MRTAVLVFVLISTVAVGPMRGQESEVAPVSAPKPVSMRFVKKWITPENVAFAANLLAESADAKSTHDFIIHPLFLCTFASPGVSMISTKDATVKSADQVCDPSPLGPTLKDTYDVSQINMFVEGGWTAKWGLAGNRNFGGTLAWNLAADVAPFVAMRVIPRFLPRRGVVWARRVEVGLNVVHAAGHLAAYMGNKRFIARNADPNRIYRQNENSLPSWMDSSPSWWGRR